MENWGLVTYRETALLIDAQNSSLAVKQRVARTVCHEISHQWYDLARKSTSFAIVLFTQSQTNVFDVMLEIQVR